jgi:DNA polymerase-3 subunit gamma/tau
MCEAANEGRALDIIEIDAASNTGVEDIRNLRERVNYAPSQARYKVYIIDEVHMLSTSASNALLKTLEEPPSYVIFILATTESHKVLPTIQSRCQRFDFRRLSQTDIVAKLAHICDAEGISIEPEPLRLVARSATGSLRDAENLLQQLTTYYGSEIELQQVQDILGITGDWRVRELVKQIVNNDVSAGIATIISVNSDGLDLRQFNRELVEYLRGLLLIKTGTEEALDFTSEEIAELKNLAAMASLPKILKAVKLFSQLEFGLDNYSPLPLELALVDCILRTGGEKEIPVEPVERAYPQPKKAAASTSPPLKTTESTPPPASTTVHEPPPAEAPQAPKASTTTPKPAAGSDIERIRANWRQVIEQAPEDSKKSPAIAILRSAGVTPVAIEGDTVVLSFRYAYHKEQMDKSENKREAQKVISNFLERSCDVRCVYEPEANHLVRAALKMGAQIIDTEER